jgi:hypothetical protein
MPPRRAGMVAAGRGLNSLEDRRYICTSNATGCWIIRVRFPGRRLSARIEYLPRGKFPHPASTVATDPRQGVRTAWLILLHCFGSVNLATALAIPMWNELLNQRWGGCWEMPLDELLAWAHRWPKPLLDSLQAGGPFASSPSKLNLLTESNPRPSLDLVV